MQTISNYHKFRRASQKLIISLIKLTEPPNERRTPEQKDNEKDASLIFYKLIKNKESELLISPLSNKCFIKNDDGNILIILEAYELTIINHVFGYNIKLSNITYHKLYKAFNVEVENRRIKMEDSFRKNVKHSLQTLISKIHE
jgi:hypothetical protein